MFTGIITKLGLIKSIIKINSDWIVEIEILQSDVPYASTNDLKSLNINANLNNEWQKIQIGNSIACDGICLTIIDVMILNLAQTLKVQISETTRQVTNVNYWQEQSIINLELALRIGSPLDGHFVLGHIDAVVKFYCDETLPENLHCRNHDICSHIMKFEMPETMAKFISHKGSLTINGIALTINEVNDEDHFFSVNIIPYTYMNTNVKYFVANKTYVNIEIDMMTRYMTRYIDRIANLSSLFKKN